MAVNCTNNYTIMFFLLLLNWFQLMQEYFNPEFLHKKMSKMDILQEKCKRLASYLNYPYNYAKKKIPKNIYKF